MATKTNNAIVESASEIAYNAIADAIDANALNHEIVSTAENMIALDADRTYANKIGKVSWTFAIDENELNWDYIRFIDDFQIDAKQATNDLVKMAMLRYVESKSGKTFTGHVPVTRAVHIYDAKQMVLLKQAITRAVIRNELKLAILLRAFGATEKSREACDAVIESAKQNKRARKVSKVTTIVAPTNSIADVALTPDQRRAKLIEMQAKLADELALLDS